MAIEDTISLSSATATSGPVMVPRAIGSIRLIREIGRGAMGVVFLGRDTMLGRDVAVKFLLEPVRGRDDPECVRFIAGARTVASLKHPNLVTLLHADILENHPYLVMEFISGRSLESVVADEGKFDFRRALGILRAVAGALAKLHDHGVVHRDLKPANILLDDRGGVFVTDYGLTRMRTEPGVQQGTEIAGTPGYMAPETFDGIVTPRTDVYALGMTAFVMLAGSLPFDTRDWREARSWHQRCELPIEDLSGTPPELVELIQRAVRKDPTFRYKNASAMLRSFNALARRFGVLPSWAAASAGHAEVDAASAAELPPAGYFDRLSKLAARRRSAEDDHTEAAADANRSRRPRPVSRKVVEQDQRNWAYGVLTAEVPCVRCQYNLCGLFRSELCPECGAAIQESLAEDRLLFGHPAWLASLRRSAWVLCIALPIYFLLAAARAFFLLHWRGDALMAPMMLTELFSVGAMYIAGVALAMLAREQNDRWAPEADSWRSHVSTASGVCRIWAALALGIGWIAVLADARWDRMGFGLLCIECPVLLFCIGMAMLFCAELSDRLPDQGIAHRCAIGCCLCFIASPVLLLVLLSRILGLLVDNDFDSMTVICFMSLAVLLGVLFWQLGGRLSGALRLCRSRFSRTQSK